MKRISAIICAYNEKNTIESVIRAASQSKLLSEIIVVNDGSEDKTSATLQHLRNEIDFKIIHLVENMGKGYAMATGVEQSTGGVIAFIDADLYDLNPCHIDELITPILKDEVDMVLGQPSETVINYAFNPFKVLTGERTVLKSDILPILENMRTSRFGVETLINLYYKANGKKVKYISLNGLKHPTKFQKTSVTDATKQFAAEGHEIAITLFKNYDLILNSMMNKLIKEEQKMKTKEIKKQIVADMNEANKVVKESLNDLADKLYETKSELKIKIKNAPVTAKKTMQAAERDVKDLSGRTVEIGKSTFSGMQKGIKKGTK
jgi:glycosyltransferase involved in cell wall biosynthesis